MISHAQNTTALQLNVFLTGIRQFLVADKGRSSFPSTNLEGQLQTPEVLSVLDFVNASQLYVVAISARASA